MGRVGEITVKDRLADSEDTLSVAVGLQEPPQKDVERRASIGFQSRWLEEEPRSLPWRNVGVREIVAERPDKFADASPPIRAHEVAKRGGVVEGMAAFLLPPGLDTLPRPVLLLHSSQEL